MLPLLSSPSAVTAGPGAKGGGFGPQARILPASFQPEACELLSSKYNHLFLADGVIGAAAQARAVFDERFAQPRNAQPERFVWDFWHVTHRPEDLPCPRSSPSPESSSSGKPTEFDSLAEATSAAANSECSGYGSISPAAAASAAAASGQQYTMLRTAASDYFNSSLFEELCTQITEYGREQLGCDAITPPWLALYTDGCSQNFHSDAPHGPFAFVLSLTPEGAYAPQDGSATGWFEGGETTILRPEVCDYWRGYDSSRGLEFHSLFQTVAPLWNRLTVFDSRLPHAVSPVRGTRDPRRGRLVLTGWFSEPQPTFRGGLGQGDEAEEEATRVVERASADLQEQLAESVSRAVGFIAIRLVVDGDDGRIKSLESLCDTLVADPEDRQGPIGTDSEGNAVLDDGAEDIRVLMNHIFSRAHFPSADSDSTITVPFSFS